jgi:hypothetical protein
VLRRIEELAKAGAVVVAPRPAGGLGLASPDQAVTEIAARLWPAAGTGPLAIGKGRIYGAASLQQALAAERIAPDVAPAPGVQLMSVHRQLGDTDFYFITNRDDRAVTAPLTFRVSGKAAEWWSAEEGRTRPLSYAADGQGTRVDVPLDPKGAGFVVFRPSAAASRTVKEPQIVSQIAVEGRWDLSFEPGRGGPATATFPALTDWSRSDDPAIRYFSGSATYRKKISVPGAALKRGQRVMLDLGDVRELASVTINGKAAGTAWHAPYRMDVTDGLKAGRNLIEVKVTNLWVNRLIGDRQPGAKAIAFAPQSRYQADSPLRPSGLLGPVRLMVEEGP